MPEPPPRRTAARGDATTVQRRDGTGGWGACYNEWATRRAAPSAVSQGTCLTIVLTRLEQAPVGMLARLAVAAPGPTMGRRHPERRPAGPLESAGPARITR